MTRTAARLKRALAMHMSCRCPTDRLLPSADTATIEEQKAQQESKTKTEKVRRVCQHDDTGNGEQWTGRRPQHWRRRVRGGTQGITEATGAAKQRGLHLDSGSSTPRLLLSQRARVA